MPKVLVVDDALTERVRVAGLVSQWLDSEVLEAADGREALECVETQLPDLVLTDLQMPEMTGLELVEALREGFPHIPVILMTAQGSEEIAAKALRAGAASYVPKQQLAEDLHRTLTQVFATSKVAHSQSRLMHCVTGTQTTFRLPNDIPLLHSCTGQLVNMLRCLPLGDEAERLRVGIALQEALMNACLHGNLQVREVAGDDRRRYLDVARQNARSQPWGLRRIVLSADISRDRAVFVVRDEGSGFNTQAIDDSLNVDDDNRRGRGITLMKSIMDEVSFNESGNEVTMIKRAVRLDEEELDEEDEA